MSDCLQSVTGGGSLLFLLEKAAHFTLPRSPLETNYASLSGINQFFLSMWIVSKKCFGLINLISVNHSLSSKLLSILQIVGWSTSLSKVIVHRATL